MLGAVSLTEVISWGVLYYAFAVFVAPMHAELGWSPVALSGAYSLALLCAGLAAVPIGRWLDRHGPRALMTVGSLLAAWSQVGQLWAFYLIMAGVGFASAAVLYEPAFVIVATWFRRQRGRALTVLTFFGAWASFVFIPLSQWLIDQVGWRAALLVLAALLGVATIPLHALVLRRHPADLGLHVDGAAISDGRRHTPPEQSSSAAVALRDRWFWWMSAVHATSQAATVAMTVHLIGYLVEQGQSTGVAATVAGLFGLMSLAGRLLIGPLGDRVQRLVITAVLFAMQTSGLIILFFLPTAAGAILYIMLFGAGAGTLTIMRAALLAERYGPAQYGSISGVQNLLLTMTRTLAPVGAGAVAAFGGYRLLIGLLAVLMMFGGVTLLFVDRSSRR